MVRVGLHWLTFQIKPDANNISATHMPLVAGGDMSGQNYVTMNHQARRRRLEGSSTTSKLNKIFARDRGICQLCFKECKREDATRDHIKEAKDCTKEEARSLDNLRLAHSWCNEKRSRPTKRESSVHPRLPLGKPRTFKDSQGKPHLGYTIAEAFPDFPWTSITSEPD